MKLLNELQERRRVLCEARDVMRADLLQTEAELYDLYRAIGALEPTVEAEGRAMLAEAALEPPPAAVTEPEPEPEPQDDADEKPVEQITVLYGDAIIEGEPQGFAPTVTAEPHAIGYMISEGQSLELLSDGTIAPLTPTKPEADALAKAADYYSPEAVAERNKFNPFGMFRKEDGQ